VVVAIAYSQPPNTSQVVKRRQFARSLAANQLIQKKLVDMQTEITLGLRFKDAGRDSPRWSRS
jgi:alkylation response protein AidB-like acyl-CoA dehydrogenase